MNTAVTPHPDISILIVSWNVRDLILRCLSALPAAVGENLQYEVIVIDNASVDGTVAAINAQHPGVTVLANQNNLGFSGGNNQAMAMAQCPIMLLLNPDTEPCPGSIGELYRFLQAYPQIGIVGPRLRYGDGSIQSSRRRFPTILTLFTESTIIQQYLPQLALFRRYTMADYGADKAHVVGWLVGAVLCVRRSVYKQIGGFDENLFMYSEELDWCRRTREAGWMIAYDPAAEIIHYEGKSSEQVVAARHIRFFRSRIRYTRKYHGKVAAGLLRWWLLATFVFQWLREAIKWLLGHKRQLRAERLVAYRQVLVSGLR